MLKKLKKVGCAMLAIALIMTACFPYGAWAKASTTTDTTIAQLYANANGNFFTFKLDGVDWGTAASLTAPGATNYDYSFWQNIRLYQGEEDTTGTTLWDASDKQIYYNFFDSGNTVGICILSDIYAKATKIVIPAGTAFPSYKATGGTTPFNGVDGDDVAADATGTTYVIKEDLFFVGKTDASSGVWEYWKTTEDTTVETLDVKDGRMVFNIANDVDNDALTAFTYISKVTHDNFNVKDAVEIYITGESKPKTLNDFYKTSDGNMYWNLYEAGSMAFPLKDGTLDCTKIEKIVVKKGCEFPAFASTGGYDLYTGAFTAATLAGYKAYVVGETLTFVPTGNTTSASASFVLQSEYGSLEGVVANPANGATVSLLTGPIYEFVTNYEQLLAKEYCTGKDRYMPTPVTITWEEVEGATGYGVQISLKEDMSDAKQYKANGTSATIEDLYAGEHYFYQVLVQMNGKTYQSEIFDFHTSNLPRTVEVDGVSNTRDIGGYYTMDGKYRVRQGMAYRGANADTISKEGKQKLLDDFGVKTDLDLRGELNASPLGETVNFVNVSAPQYMQIELGSYDEYKEALKEEIRTFANPDNYPIFYHCQIGRDRTGTLTLLIGALLGLSEEDLYRDYEMSFLSSAGGGSNPDIEKYVQNQFGDAMTYLKNFGDGSLAENAEQYMLALGVKQGEIDAIRAILLEEVGDVEEEATTVERIQVRNGKLLVYLTVNDYSKAQANEKIGNKIEKYNILDKVMLYTGDTESVSLREAWTGETCYNALDENGCVAFTLKNGYDGTTLKKVLIKAGSQFPAAAYTKGELENRLSYVVKMQAVYVTDTEANDNNDWVLQDDSEPKKVSLNKIQSGHNGDIITFTLSESDYDGLSNETISAKHTAYNYLEKICIYTSDTEYVTLGEALVNQRYYNMWGNKDTISLQLDPQIYQNAKKIVVPVGTVFPSAAYTNGIASFKCGYVVENELVFTKPADAQDGLGVGSAYAYDWELNDDSVPTDTSVTKIRSGHNAEIITFYLTNSDYAQGTIGESHVKYNYWENIRIYSDETNYKTLGQVYTNQKYYNMWNHGDTLSVQLTQEAFNSVVKIVIPEGTIFPSYNYTNTGVPQKGGYKTTEELVFVKPVGTGDLMWTVEDSGETGGPAEPEEPKTDVETDVTNIHIRYGQNEGYRLLFFLNQQDYGTGANALVNDTKLEEYNIFNNILLVTTTGEEILLADAYDNVAMYNIWTESGSFSVKLKDGIAPIEKIVIKAGSEFPASEYTEGTLAEKFSYVVKSETIFTTATTPADNTWSIQWNKEKVLPRKEVQTDVTNIHVRTGENEGARLLLFLDMHDYGADFNVAMQSSFFEKYNTLKNIVLYTTAGEEYVLADIYDNVSMFNVWGEVGTFSVMLKKGIKPIEKVVVKANCEFPSRAFTEGKGDYQTTYVVPFETVFTTGTTPTDNLMTVYWEKAKNLPVDVKDTEVMSAQFIGREGDVRLLLFLDKQDYVGIGNSVFTTSKFKQYNTLENVILCRGDRKISLSEIVTDEVYYNLWGKEGCISYGLKDEYTLDSFDKVLVKSGCEFPAYAYTANESAQQMTAYTTTKEKTITATQAKYKLTYYDANKKVLYEEELPFGTELTLKAVPKKKGYEGKWEGLKYETMPAQDISYYLSYTKGMGKKPNEEEVEEPGKEPEMEQSPVTGDWNVTSLLILLLLSSAIVIVMTLKKKDIIGGRNERQ